MKTIGWIAMDEDGEWFFYYDEPFIDDDGWSSGGNYEVMEDYKQEKTIEDWIESRQEVFVK